MKLVRRFALAAFILVLVGAAWIWWNRPQQVDMASYAPADSLVFLEANRPLEIAEAVLNTDAWKLLKGSRQSSTWSSRWFRRLVYWTGLGDIRTVILTRSQVALVALDMGVTEQGETLKFKPEAAILIETHTSERRIRSTVEENLRRFAEQMYKTPQSRRYNESDSEFIVWTAPDGTRQIVATIVGSLVIVGNSESAVRACLEVRNGQRPNLASNPELQRTRDRLAANNGLTFGFISASNAERLFSLAVPVLFGRAPGNVHFDKVLAPAAPKVIAGVAWASKPYGGGIEDRYLILLQPAFKERLRPAFRLTDANAGTIDFLPEDFYSATFYRLDSPLTAWQILESAVSAQLDTVAAVVFGSLLKTSLASYGIDDPEKFLSLIGPGPATIRLAHESERSVLIAKVLDEEGLRKLLGIYNSTTQPAVAPEPMAIPGKPTSTSFIRDMLLLGRAEDVRSCIQTGSQNPTKPAHERLARIQHFLRFPESAGIVTYANDSDRVIAFLNALALASSRTAPTPAPGELRNRTRELPYAATQTTLTEDGLERTTRSPLGQFSTLLPLIFPNQ